MTATAKPPARYSRLEIGHVGQAMILIADTYHNLFDVVLEQVQNSLDAGAKKVWLDISHKTRDIYVRDNGTGVTPEEFDSALASVLVTQKSSSKLGQFGRGLVSPLDKCWSFTLTSRSVKAESLDYHSWEFETKRIQNSREEIKIPLMVRKDLVPLGHNRKGAEEVPWNTQIHICNYTTDARISRVTCEQVKNGILERFREVMLRNDVEVRLHFTDANGKVEKQNIKASPFAGDQLPEERYGDPDRGQILVRLFQSPWTAKGRGGKVLLGVEGEIYRFPSELLKEHTPSRQLIGKEIIEALTSGVFNGEILVTKCRLHASRKHFVDDETLLEFALNLELWFEEFGKAHLTQLKEEREDERFQILGREALCSLKELFTGDNCPEALRQVLKGFEIGSLGTHHASVSKKRLLGPSDQPTLSADGGITKEKKKGGGGGESTDAGDGPKQKENVDHTPLLAAGPVGRKRQLVQENSVGLTISHEEMPGSDKLWDLDTRLGVLAFNIRHPLWQECESKDSHLVQLQVYVALQALTLHGLDLKSQYELVRMGYDELTSSWVSMLTRQSKK